MSTLIDNFTIIFMSILLEAMPFVLLGAMIAAAIQLFVTEEQIQKWIPKNKALAFLTVASVGIIFPVCECAIIPIMRKLVKKGMPIDLAITLMLAVPIMNPVVLLSTYYAFQGDWSVVVLRGLLGMTGAIAIGYLSGKLGKRGWFKDEPALHRDRIHLKSPRLKRNVAVTGLPSSGAPEQKKSIKEHLYKMFEHSSHEFYEVGRLLIFGAFLSATLQTFVPRTWLMSIGSTPILSVVGMMLLAFLLSLCSEADAFIARTFVGQFTDGSIMAFLIFGPMLDLKNTLMLGASMRKIRLIQLMTLIVLICLIIGLLVNTFGEF